MTVDINLTIAEPRYFLLTLVRSIITFRLVAESGNACDAIHIDPVRHCACMEPMTFRSHSMISKLIALSAALLTLTGAVRSFEQKPLGPVSVGTPRPVVIWHGLGDTSTGSGMAQFKEDLEDMYPGIYVMNAKIPAGGTLDDERKAGFVSHDEQSSENVLA